eukprot:15472436-Alexandrium_andersonii.AAC.1
MDSASERSWSCGHKVSSGEVALGPSGGEGTCMPKHQCEPMTTVDLGTGPDRTGQGKAGQSRAGLGSTGQDLT